MTADVLLFGKHHSDHIASVKYDVEKGWDNPVIKPFQPIKVNPFTSSLHYGLQCFEGLKAYKNVMGEIRLFRPECNALRLKRSSQRLSLPDFDGNELINLICEFIKVEDRWVPPITEFSFYIRPLHISTEVTLGIKKPTHSELFLMGGPVGPYYPTGFKPVSLSCMVSSIRSAPRGTGAFKIGGYSWSHAETMLLLCTPLLLLLLKVTSKFSGSIMTRLSRSEPQTFSLSSRTPIQEKSKWPRLSFKTWFFQVLLVTPSWYIV